MVRMLNDNWSLEDIQSAMRKLKTRNNMNLLLIFGVAFIVLAAIIAFFAYRCRCEEGFDCCCGDDDYDDDFCCGGDDGNVATDDDFEK